MSLKDRGPIKGLLPLQLFQLVFDNLFQGVITIKNGKVFYANKACAKMLGYPFETIMNWSVEELFTLLLTQQDELKKSYESGGDPDREGLIRSFQIAASDGEIKYVEMIPVRFVLNEEEYHHALIIDATERVIAIQRMKESEERFRETFDSIPDPAYLWEQNDQGEVSLKLANKRVIDMSRGFVKKLIGKSPNELFLDNPEFSEYIRFTMNTGESIKTETTITHPEMPLFANVIVDCVKPSENLVLMINTDITEERKTQESLRRSEKEKSLILDSMQDHLIFYDTEDLTISWANKAAAESIRLSISDLVGKHCYELWHSRQERCEGCPVFKAWETGERQENEMTTPDGRVWLVKGLPVKNAAEHVTAVIEVTREITAEKEAKATIQEAKERAELYLDLLSHDLNNIHQGIVIGLELSLQDESLGAKSRDALETSLKQVKRGVNLISNVQKFTKILDSPVHLVETNLISVINAAITMVRNSFPQRSLEVNLNSPMREIMVYADEFLVDGIYNILHNSLKHETSEIVKIDLVININEESSTLELLFEDFGPGIEDESKRNLESRLNSGIKVGTGMGLTLVKRILDRYGGGLSIQDRVEGDYKQGVCFVLSFPVHNK